MKTGRCLCGAVSFTADVSDEIQACHCTQCQRWTGGGPLYAVRVKNLAVSGETEIAQYHHSEWGERAWCKRCGSTLYWKLAGRRVAFVAPGLLDDQTGMSLTEEIFVETRAPWMMPVDGAAQRKGAELEAELQAFLEAQNE